MPAVQLDLFSSCCVAAPAFQSEPQEPEFRKLEPTHRENIAAEATHPLITETCPAFSIAAEHLARAKKGKAHRFAVKTSVEEARRKMRGD